MVDVFVSSMGVPTSAVEECATTLGAKIIGVSDEEADKVIAKVPFYAKMAIPANTYSGQTEPINTIADVNVYVRQGYTGRRCIQFRRSFL